MVHVLRRLCVVAACWLLPGGTIVAQPVPPAGRGPSAIDRTIVLKIGPHELSAYGLEKNFNRFHGGRPAGAVSGQALQDWFRLFLAQQAILARAVADGYLERPEVTAMVERMATHMLTQTEGPYYATLAPPELDEAELEKLHARTANVRHVVLARFRDAAEADRMLGADFRARSETEKTQWLRAASMRPGVVWHDGPLAWPYEPFPEVGEALEKLAPGEWLYGVEGEEGHSVAQVRRIETRSLPAFAAAREQFARFVRMIRKVRAQRQHRTRVLREAEFASDDAALARLAARLREVPLDAATGAILPAAVAPIGELRLFSYTQAGAREAVSVARFAEYFNQRFVRPRTLELEALRQAAADMALANLDLAAARALGLDRTPQFEEDRKNFRNYQALDWFEKERLRPGLAIDEAAIAARYEAQRARFTQPAKAGARRLVFADWADAARFLDRHRGGAAGPAIQPLEESEVEIDRGAPPAGLENLTEPLLRAAPGAVFGPLQQGEQALVWLRGATLREETAPLASVAAALRQELERAALDAKEIALAREFAAAFAVEDRIDYARYGVDPATVAAWGR